MKAFVLGCATELRASAPAVREETLKRVARQPCYNTSRVNPERQKGTPNHVAARLSSYINAFSGATRNVLERLRFDEVLA